MPDAVNSKFPPKDEAYFKAAVEGLGGVQTLVRQTDEYQEIVARMHQERPLLAEQHPDKWIAMGLDGVLAVGESMEAVLTVVERKGLNGGDVVIELLDSDPPLLIL